MSISHAKFSSYFIGMLVILLGLIAANNFLLRTKKITLNPFTGLGILAVGLITGLLSMYSFSAIMGFETSHIFNPIFKSLYCLLGLLLLVLSAASWGNKITSLLGFDWKKGTDQILDIGVGIVWITIFMFLVGTIGLLLNFILIPFILIGIGINWQYALEFIKRISIKALNTDPFVSNKVIAVSFVLIAFLSLNFIANQIPFPPGFDSRNFYLNISNLIGAEGGIISGFSPYNWSLLMSYGFVAFKSAEIAFGVSYLGFLLSMWAVYSIMRVYLKLPVFESLLVITIYAVTPAITNQLFVEYKIDFGLLFMQLLSILLIFKIYEGKKSPIKNKDFNKKLFALVALLGVFTGFGLGIKLTNLYLVLALACFIWFYEGEIKGFFGIASLILFFIFLTRFDDLSGLSQYHLGVDRYKYVFLLVGFGLLAWLFEKNKPAFLKAIKISIIYGLTTAITIMPWMVKNAKDANGKITAEKLLIGSNPGPKMNLKIIDNNFQAEIKKNK